MLFVPKTVPFSIALLNPNFVLSDILRISSCAILDIIVSLSSPSLEAVTILSDKKYTHTSYSNNFLV